MRDWRLALQLAATHAGIPMIAKHALQTMGSVSLLLLTLEVAFRVLHHASSAMLTTTPVRNVTHP